MTRSMWWLGIAAIVVALLAHAMLPRFEWRTVGPHVVRVDRWTGHAQAFHVSQLRD